MISFWQPHVICVPVPLYHCFGCGMGVLTAALHGASCVFPSPVFSAKAAVKAIHDERYNLQLLSLYP